MLVSLVIVVIFQLLYYTQQQPPTLSSPQSYFLDQIHEFQQKNEKNYRKLLLFDPEKESRDNFSLKNKILKEYFSTEKLEEWADDFLDRCGEIARKFSIGKSVQNRDLWVLEISNNPGKIEAKPNIKYVGNIHGDEPSGRQLLPQFAEFLCENYKIKGSNSELIVNHIHLFLMPCMNPDGFEKQTRENYNRIDLNRNFPDQYNHTRDFWSEKILPFEQPETVAMHQWSLSRHFVSSLQFHEGQVVVTYPYDGRPDLSEEPVYQKAPDDKTFRFLAEQYVDRNSLIKNDPRFKTGISNGANFYPLYGGSQDWNYLIAKSFELTLEISGQKTLDPDVKYLIKHILPYLWSVNRDAMINFALSTAFGGVRGFVLNEMGGPLHGAIISVEGVQWQLPVYSQYGDFTRPLAPGNYTITASCIGYKNYSTVVEVPKDGSGIQIKMFLKREEPDLEMKISRP